MSRPNEARATLARLSSAPRANLIAERWCEAASGDRFEITNPATGEPLASVPDSGPTDAIAAVVAAARASAAWAAWSPRDRSRLLSRVADRLEEASDELAVTLTLEQGKPLAEARSEIAASVEQFEWYAGEARRAYGEVVPRPSTLGRIFVLRQPVGVVLAITPWNYPASMVARKLAPALAAGCTVVLKPAPETPLTALAMAELMLDAGLPPGVVNVVTTDHAAGVVRAALGRDEVRKLTFTGSTGVGRLLGACAGTNLKRSSLELGGHCPCLVFDDADIDRAAETIAANKFRNCGQSCVAINRIYVDDRIADRFVDALAGVARKLVPGNGLDPLSTMGPLIDAAALDKVMQHVADASHHGARIVTGGQRAIGDGFDNGHYYEATVLSGVNDGVLVTREETFGPVAPVLRFDSEPNVIARANDTRAGLVAYAFTSSLDRAIRVVESLEYGMVGVNSTRLTAAQAPFGGIKDSGIGREGGHWGLDEFLELKYVGLELEPTAA